MEDRYNETEKEIDSEYKKLTDEGKQQRKILREHDKTVELNKKTQIDL